MRKKPFIGLTLDIEPAGGYAQSPWYALRQNYIKAIEDAGGIAVPLPHALSHIADYTAYLDGLLLTGGGFDIPPSFYGCDDIHPKVTLKPERSLFEYQMAKAFFEHHKPIFGICGGMQLINVMCGGTLIQDIPSQCLKETHPNLLTHLIPKELPFHPIVIEEGTSLHQLYQDHQKNASCSINVNSSHHQAIDKLGDDLIITARAPDGIIEGIEHTTHPFCKGVQWHPEYQQSTIDKPLLQTFIHACQISAKEQPEIHLNMP